MQRSKKLTVQRADVFLILFLLLSGIVLCCFCFSPAGSPGKYLEVRQNGALILTLPLEKNTSRTISPTPKEYNTITIENGKAVMSDASCKDKTCVHSGSISKTGESIVCLPHRIVLSISGEQSGGQENQTAPDAVTR